MNTRHSIVFRLLRWLAGFPIIILAAAFAVANRQTVLFYWSPLHAPLELPFCFFLLGALGLGFLFGGLVSWIGTSNLRRERRAQKREIKDLQQQLKKAANGNAPEPRQSFYALPPALPDKKSDAAP